MSKTTHKNPRPLTVLKSQVSALLAVERAQASEAYSWMVMYDAPCGLRYVVGKGDRNTMFYTFGNQSRKVCYPDEIMIILRGVKYEGYFLVHREKEKGPFLSVQKVLRTEPRTGWKLYGQNGTHRKLVAKAQRNLLKKELEWVSVD